VEDRAAVFLKGRRMLATTWRPTLNAATMLGQSKTAYQAEIDSAVELIDFWRFNPHYAQSLYDEQPISDRTMWNQLDYRPLEGFVYAVTPFNFTSIAEIFRLRRVDGEYRRLEAGVERDAERVLHHEAARGGRASSGSDQLRSRGDAALISDTLLSSRDLAGVHFTGSTAVFNSMWKQSAPACRATSRTRALSARRAGRTSSSPTRRPIRLHSP